MYGKKKFSNIKDFDILINDFFMSLCKYSKISIWIIIQNKKL